MPQKAWLPPTFICEVCKATSRPRLLSFWGLILGLLCGALGSGIVYLIYIWAELDVPIGLMFLLAAPFVAAACWGFAPIYWRSVLRLRLVNSDGHEE